MGGPRVHEGTEGARVEGQPRGGRGTREKSGKDRDGPRGSRWTEGKDTREAHVLRGEVFLALRRVQPQGLPGGRARVCVREVAKVRPEEGAARGRPAPRKAGRGGSEKDGAPRRPRLPRAALGPVEPQNRADAALGAGARAA